MNFPILLAGAAAPMPVAQTSNPLPFGLIFLLIIVGTAAFLCWRIFHRGEQQCAGKAGEEGASTSYYPGRPMEYYILNIFGLLTLAVGVIILWKALTNGPEAMLLFSVSAIIVGLIICGFASIISATYRTEKLTAQILEKLKK